MKKALVTLLVVGVIGGSGYAYYHYKEAGPESTVNTAPSRAATSSTPSARPGTLQAVTTVQVGTQVSGTISELYADFNSLVKKGQVLARLDPSLFQTQIEQARANLVRVAGRSRAPQGRARRRAHRSSSARKELSDAAADCRSSELDAARGRRRDRPRRSSKSSEAQITQAQASLNQNEVNLSTPSSRRRSTAWSSRATSTSARRSPPACRRRRCSCSRPI